MKVCIRIARDGKGGYTAICPSLPGCVSRGTTREEVTSRMDEAIRGYIAAVSNFVPERVIHEVVERV
jgi:predicted RNase H-like HicB family nuclease